MSRDNALIDLAIWGGFNNLLIKVTFKDHRRKGLAQKLIEFAILDARRKNINRINLHCGLETKKAAWTLYEKLGFVRIKEELDQRAKPRKRTLLSYEMKL